MQDERTIRDLLEDATREDEKQPGLLARLLMGIPQAISVGLSQDPGAALGQQIGETLKQRQIEKQRKQRLKELGATLEIEDILAKRKEGRQLANQKELSAYESDIRNAEYQVKSAEDREQMRMKLEFDKSLEGIRHTNNRDVAQMQIDANTNLEKYKQEGDIARMKLATQLQEVVKVMPYLKVGEAADIFSRAMDGKVTSNDITAIQAAAKRGEREEFRQRYEIAVGPAREQARLMMVRNTQAEVLEAIRKKSFEQEWMWVTDTRTGQKQLFKYDIDSTTQSVVVPPGYKFESKANPVDVYKHFLPLMDAFKGTENLNPTDLTPEQSKDQRIDKYIGGLPSSMTVDDKIKSLADPRVQETLQMTPQDIERTKAKLMAQAPGQGDSPTDMAIREIDEELKALEPLGAQGVQGFGYNQGLSPEQRKLKAKLLDERYNLIKRQKDESQVTYLEQELAQKEAELSTARTEVRKTRLKNEIEAPRTGLKARLAYAKSQVGK